MYISSGRTNMYSSQIYFIPPLFLRESLSLSSCSQSLLQSFLQKMVLLKWHTSSQPRFASLLSTWGDDVSNLTYKHCVKEKNTQWICKFFGIPSAPLLAVISSCELWDLTLFTLAYFRLSNTLKNWMFFSSHISSTLPEISPTPKYSAENSKDVVCII